MKLAINPVNQHKMDKFVRGAQGFSVGGPGNSVLAGHSDLDGDGKNEGIMFTDPSTGKQVVQVPLFGALAQAMSGVPFGFQIQTSSLSMQSTVLPGIGPVVAIAADVALPKTQDWQPLLRLLMPYGPPAERSAIDFFVPAWAQRAAGGAAKYADFLNGIDQYLFNPENNRQFQFMRARSLQALASRNTYEPGLEGTKQLAEDADRAASALWLMRGVAQLFLPSAPMTTYYAYVDKKRIPLGVILDDIRRTEQVFVQQGRTRADAHEAIVNRWGDFIIPYLASLSTSKVPGSEPSIEFEKFRDKNSTLFKDFPDVAGFFAPKTFAMDAEVYQLQRQLDEREYLPIRELLDSIGALTAGILYRREEANLPAAIRNTPGGRAVLALKADEIQQAYPMWNPGAYALERRGIVEAQINNLIQALDRPYVQQLDAYRPIVEYLGWRSAVIATIRKANPAQAPDSWKTNQSGALQREVLFQQGERIAKENPAFLNAWDSLFSREFKTLDIRELVGMDQRQMIGSGVG